MDGLRRPEARGVPPAHAAHLANGTAHSGGGTVPAFVAQDFAVATRWVLGGMAIALALSFLVSLAHRVAAPGPPTRRRRQVPNRYRCSPTAARRRRPGPHGRSRAHRVPT